MRVTVVGERVFAPQVTAPGGALDWRRSGGDARWHAPVQGRAGARHDHLPVARDLVVHGVEPGRNLAEVSGW